MINAILLEDYAYGNVAIINCTFSSSCSVSNPNTNVNYTFVYTSDSNLTCNVCPTATAVNNLTNTTMDFDHDKNSSKCSNHTTDTFFENLMLKILLDAKLQQVFDFATPSNVET